jgi:squalene-hopene/tetraprenyl-beta-curcumene cyclase
VKDDVTATALAAAAHERSLARIAADELVALQRPDGHFVFELEADVTIPAETILLQHFLGRIDHAKQARLALYLRQIQNADGSWPLFAHGAGDLSATVKGYWALKLAGDPIDAPHMAAARAWIMAAGGANKSNVFTRFALALFGHVPWRAVPAMPVELMLLPEWFPFHVSKIAYWSRTVLVPLTVLASIEARAANPTGLGLDELFDPPAAAPQQWNRNPNGSKVGEAFLSLDTLLHAARPFFPGSLRDKAIERAMAFVENRLNGEDGLGGIFPAMANARMAMHALGWPQDDPRVVMADAALAKLETDRGAALYVQPCLSPVWDTALAANALLEDGGEAARQAAFRALDWLAERQVLDVVGDWAVRRPGVRPGGWAFQYANPHYPDVDDTAVVAVAMHRADPARYATAIARAVEWILGMQSSSGGWGAFEPENEHYHLNAIPFADHGALLDPPTVDVTARCLGVLAQVDPERRDPAIGAAIDRAVAYLRREQEADGSWFGRWGSNYVYGTWSALAGLNAAGVARDDPALVRAAGWLKAAQRADGGWGEGLETYEPGRRGFARASTPSQTAWAMLGLMAAGEANAIEVTRGARWLADAPRDGARWAESEYTGTGFPRVFYLKYHGYAAYFPAWALARHERLKGVNDPRVEWGL